MARKNDKKRRKPAEQHRVGRRIRAREVRVIDHTGEQLGIMDTRAAMERADSLGLQLVEVNPKANPPVCKIMDYGRYKYEMAKKERDARRNQTRVEVKEVKFRPKTAGHDFDYKLRHVRRFLEDGDKVRLLVQFRGREVVHPETGRSILERVCKEVADLATVVQMPSMEGNRMNMILAPKKSRQQAAGKGGGGRSSGEKSQPPGAEASGRSKPAAGEAAAAASTPSDAAATGAG
ncbi:MAG: translation initiation factor IF-3 [Deltaproteobacteria bacterium]|nr:MAG: translation initiation factor IF-3 [Deltaproteobacteria bacterium]